MDTYSIIERLKPFSVPILLGVFGLGFLFYGFISLTAHPQEKQDIVFEPASNQSAQADEKLQDAKSRSAGKITVDIEGGVIKPGVYMLPQESRIQDVLLAAGGMSESANHEMVAKTLNLAAKLTDGAKIYIPLQGDSGLLGSSDSTQNVLGSATFNLNSASASDLDKLPGVGTVTAQKIIGGRPYSSVDELLSKKIVSKKVFDQIKEKVSIY